MKRFLLSVLAVACVGFFASTVVAGSSVGLHLVDRVEAESTASYWVTFYGGYPAEMAVVGDHDTDLDLYVYDEFGHLIASDTDYSDTCYAQWTPAWTGRFRIEIVNRGNVYNVYSVATN